MNTPENSAIGQANHATDDFAAQKIPPRLSDRMDLHARGRGSDNLPALKNQLQLAMEMLQKAMEENLAAERRRMRRMMSAFIAAMALLALMLLGGMGWFMIQLRQLTPAAPASADSTASAPAPAEKPPPADSVPSLKTEETKPPPEKHDEDLAAAEDKSIVPPAPPPSAADMEILRALQNDLMVVEEKSRALDELMSAQDLQLQAIMDDVVSLNAEMENPPPVIDLPGQFTPAPLQPDAVSPHNAMEEEQP